MEHQRKPAMRKLWFMVGMVFNLLPFALYKYGNFFLEVIQDASHLFGQNIAIHQSPHSIPIGISFFTLQSMGYLIDVYKGKIRAEKHLGIFAAFLSFFPQILSGPIERAGHMLPQLHEKQQFQQREVLHGIKLIFFGLCKKILIADSLAPYVTEVFSHPTFYTGLPLVFGTVFFSIQLYYDFSGYTDIAIGLARLFGFQLNPNFLNPFAAISISDFWRRWHISLSSWLRDYVYIPLGGNRVSLPRQILNVLVVFLLSGLWHGAAWTFVIWGVIHGTYIAFGLILRPINTRLAAFFARFFSEDFVRMVRILRTYGLLCFAWIFFRSQSVTDALYTVTHIFPNAWRQLPPVVFRNTLDMLLITPTFLLFVLLSLAALFVFHFHESWNIRDRMFRLPAAFHWAVLYTLIFLFFFVAAGNATFLYAQF